MKNNYSSSTAAKGFKRHGFLTLSMILCLFVRNVNGQGTLGNCKLNCTDTTICFSVPDTSVHLLKPTYTSQQGSAGGSGPDHCINFVDSIWNNAPGIYPVGT